MKTEEIFAVADSVFPMSFLNEKTARPLQENDKSLAFDQTSQGETARILACYKGESIIPKGRLIATIQSGGLKIKAASFIIVDDQKANLIGRKNLPHSNESIPRKKNKRTS